MKRRFDMGLNEDEILVLIKALNNYHECDDNKLMYELNVKLIWYWSRITDSNDIEQLHMETGR